MKYLLQPSTRTGVDGVLQPSKRSQKSKRRSKMDSSVQRNWSVSARLGAFALAAVAAVAYPAIDMAVTAWRTAQPPAPAIAATRLDLSQVDHKFLADEWNDRIATERYWRGRPNRAPASNPAATAGGRSNLQGPPPDSSWFIAPNLSPFWDPDSDRFNQGAPRVGPNMSSGYRTVCVRTCDGSFFPISSGASHAQFSRDQTTCSNACPGARLFYYRAAGEGPDDMVDLTGQPYSRMPNANLFRTQYVEACKCKPHPWEQQAVEQHRIYALEDQRRKGNRAVVAELDQLKSKSLRDKFGGNPSGGGNRKSDRTRRQADRDRGETNLAPRKTIAAQASSPRSDASRGQGGERTATHMALAPAHTSVSAVSSATASIPPSQSPVGAAATAAAGRDAGPARPDATQAVAPGVTQASIRSRSNADRVAADLPVGTSPGFEIPLQIQPDAMPAPEAIIAVPFDKIPDAAPHASESPQNSGNTRRSRSPSKGLDSAGRRGPDQSPPWQMSRTVDWTRRVFNQ